MSRGARAWLTLFGCEGIWTGGLLFDSSLLAGCALGVAGVALVWLGFKP